MPDYVVRPGECLDSIASRLGLRSSVVWNHDDNAALKAKRRDPNALLPGDRLFVPERCGKYEPCATASRHRFRRLGVPVKLRIQFLDENGDPFAGEPYRLCVDGDTTEGKLDQQGFLDTWIAPESSEGYVLLTGDALRFDLKLGELDPADEISGVQARLKNLGYDCEVTGQLDQATIAALHRFQDDHDLKRSSTLDGPTWEGIERAHDLGEHGV